MSISDWCVGEWIHTYHQHTWWCSRGAYVELKEDVVVGVLVGEGDRALFLQVDGVNQRHRTLITVWLQVHTLRRPWGAATITTKHTQQKQHCTHHHVSPCCYRSVCQSLCHLLQAWMSSPFGPGSKKLARLVKPAGMASHWSKRRPLPRE